MADSTAKPKSLSELLGLPPPKSLLPPEQLERIAQRLREKTSARRCPMCQKNEWAVVDGYIANGLQADLRQLNLGGPQLPTVGIICSSCGFLAQFAIGTLGLEFEERAAP